MATDLSYAAREFVEFLLKERMIEKTDHPKKDDYISYSDHMFRHIGYIVGDGRIRSKWGTGLIYEHSLLEIPASYGSNTHYFTYIGQDAAHDAFKRYVAEFA